MLIMQKLFTKKTALVENNEAWGETKWMQLGLKKRFCAE